MQLNSSDVLDVYEEVLGSMEGEIQEEPTNFAVKGNQRREFTSCYA